MKGRVAVKTMSGAEASAYVKETKNKAIVAVPILLFLFFVFGFLSVILNHFAGDHSDPSD